jgi:hypothetical protein
MTPDFSKYLEDLTKISERTSILPPTIDLHLNQQTIPNFPWIEKKDLSTFLAKFNSSKAQLKKIEDGNLTLLAMSTKIENAKEEYASRKFVEHAIEVRAYNTKTEEFLGSSQINFKEWNYQLNTISARGYISAQKKNCATQLLNETVKALEKYAEHHDLIITHLVSFTSPEGRTALEPKYRRNEYNSCLPDESFELKRTYPKQNS